jgi:DNA-binding NarL/FixJ family response regulator
MDTDEPTHPPSEIRVLIVDDHATVRRGLTQLLGQQAGLRVCGAVGSAEQALQFMQQQRVDLAIIDISLGQMDGIQLTRKLRGEYPDLRIVIFTMHDPSHYAPRALSAGASGFVVKQEGSETLLPAIRHVLTGRTYISNTAGLDA